MKSRWSIAALGAFFVSLALVVSGCGSSVPSNAVATVAGNPITKQAFDHWLYVSVKQQSAQEPGTPALVPNDPPQFTHCIAQIRALSPTYANQKTYPDAKLRTACQTQFTQLKSSVLGYLIESYWFQAEARKLGVPVTTAQVQKVYAAAKKKQFKTNATFQAYLKETGTTPADLMYEIRFVQTQQHLLKKLSSSVTQSQVTAYYNQHKSSFATPEKRTMRVVLAKNAADAAAAHKALTSGKSWQTVAKRYSQDPQSKNKGGLLSNVTASQQDAALSKVSFSAPTNKLIGPVKAEFGYYVLEVLKVTPGNQKTLAQTQAAIRKTLKSQAQTTAEAAAASRAKKAFMTKTHCSKIYSVSQCAGYKAPKTSTTSSSAATTPATSTTAAPSTGSASSSSTTTSATSSQ